MSMKLIHHYSNRAKAICVLLLVAFLGSQGMAADLRLDAQLIWGTNDESSPNTNHKPVDPVLAKKLKNIFKWKNYFEVKRQQIDVPSRETRKVKMSEKCSLEIVELEGPKIEVRLFGEGKIMNKTIKTLTPGEILTLAGGDKNENAWFVVIQQVEGK